MVYCGGLENRFGLTPDGGSNPSLSASLAKRDRCAVAKAKAGGYEISRISSFGSASQDNVSDLTKILIWVAVAGVIFAILWWKGQLQKITVYVQQTREELKKCTWPSWDELKGHTVLVSLTILFLSLFTVAVDYVLSHVVLWLSKT